MYEVLRRGSSAHAPRRGPTSGRRATGPATGGSAARRVATAAGRSQAARILASGRWEQPTPQDARPVARRSSDIRSKWLVPPGLSGYPRRLPGNPGECDVRQLRSCGIRQPDGVGSEGRSRMARCSLPRSLRRGPDLLARPLSGIGWRQAWEEGEPKTAPRGVELFGIRGPPYDAGRASPERLAVPTVGEWPTRVHRRLGIAEGLV